MFHDNPASESYYSTFQKEHVLTRLKAIDRLARLKGPETLDPQMDRLIPIGMELDVGGKVVRSGLGVFNLGWQAPDHPEWPGTIAAELNEIRARIKDTHGCRLRFLIWAGAGGSAEDIAMYNAVGLLNRSPRCYVLDSTDPAKLKYILEDIVRRSGMRLADALRCTLVVGMAMGMTSWEPVINLRKLAALYDKCKVKEQANVMCLAPPESALEKWAVKRDYRIVPLQLDDGNSLAGRHGGPLSRGSLYPLGLSKVDLTQWMDGTALRNEQVDSAWRLAAFLHAQALAGHNKITLVLPKVWSGIGAWTKQNFEECLCQSELFRLKIVLENKITLANYKSPKEAVQDRAFLALKLRGIPSDGPDKTGLLRRSGYPVASLTLPVGTPLSAFMQFIHYTVFGMAYLRDLKFVAPANAGSRGSIGHRLYQRSRKIGGVEKSEEWRAMVTSPRRVKHRNCVTLYYDTVDIDLDTGVLDAPATYATIVKTLVAGEHIDYAELAFFGDTRYSQRGRSLLKALHRSAERLYRSRLKMPADVYEGPATDHSDQKTVADAGRSLSTLILSEKQERLARVDYTAQHHLAQFVATRLALAGRGRAVLVLTIKDLEEPSLTSLEDFFRQAATSLKSVKV